MSLRTDTNTENAS